MEMDFILAILSSRKNNTVKFISVRANINSHNYLLKVIYGKTIMSLAGNIYLNKNDLKNIKSKRY